MITAGFGCCSTHQLSTHLRTSKIPGHTRLLETRGLTVALPRAGGGGGTRGEGEGERDPSWSLPHTVLCTEEDRNGDSTVDRTSDSPVIKLYVHILAEGRIYFPASGLWLDPVTSSDPCQWA